MKLAVHMEEEQVDCQTDMWLDLCKLFILIGCKNCYKVGFFFGFSIIYFIPMTLLFDLGVILMGYIRCSSL